VYCRGEIVLCARDWQLAARLHTCNRDHPQALANYQARGMVVYKVEQEP
jgi:hypothetical protein